MITSAFKTTAWRLGAAISAVERNILVTEVNARVPVNTGEDLQAIMIFTTGERTTW